MKEKPKQENIQEFIEKHGITEQQLIDGYKQGLDLIFENASKIAKKQQQEKSYSEEEVLELLLNCPGPYLTDDEIKQWFEKFKKK
jgi:Uma2 family endonuclease